MDNPNNNPHHDNVNGNDAQTTPPPDGLPWQRLIGAVDPLPAVGAPMPPSTSLAPPRFAARMLTKPMQTHFDVAPEAAREVRTSPVFASIIGPRIAEPAVLADAIDFAGAWYREAKAAEAWYLYSRAQSALAWNGLLQTLDKVRAPLLAAQGTDSALEREFLALTRLVTARRDPSRRAAATRRKQAEAKAASASSAAPVAASAAPAAVPAAPAGVVVPPHGGGTTG